MSLSQDIRALIKTLPPKYKFQVLNQLEDIINMIRQEVASEWTYCAGCHDYVKVSARIVTEEDGCIVTRCGNCKVTHIRKNKNEGVSVL